MKKTERQYRLWTAVFFILLAFLPFWARAQGGTLMFSLLTPYRDDDRAFEFEVRLDEPVSGEYGDLRFIEGKAAFTLSQGESVLSPGLPAGAAYTLRSFRSGGYTARYCSPDGYAVASPRGRIRQDETTGLVIAEVYTGAAEAAVLNVDLTELLPDSAAPLQGEEDSEAEGRALQLRRQRGRVLAGPLTVGASAFCEYGEKAKKTYRFSMPSAEGKEETLTAEVWMLPGSSMKAEDDVFCMNVSVEDGGEEVASASEQGSGSFLVRFARDGEEMRAAASSGGTELRLNGEVMLTGRGMKEGEFAFTVWDDGEIVARAENAGDGTLRFSPILFTPEDAGEHTLRVRQEEGENRDVTYDASEIEAEVFVGDAEGRAEARVTGLSKGGEAIGAIRFENRYALTDFKVYNLWQGGNEGQIELVLYANGERLKKQPEYAVDGATYTYYDLPVYDENGNRIVYSARELYVDDYMAVYVNTGEYASRTHMLYNGGTVINRKVKDFTFSVQIGGGGKRPDLTFTLYCNGRPYYTETQPERDEYGRYVYRHLPVKVRGEPAVYTVVVNEMPGVAVVYEGADPAGGAVGAAEGGRIRVWCAPATGDGQCAPLWPLLLCTAGLLILRKRRTA